MQLAVSGIRHSYDGRVNVLDGIDLEIWPGETVALMGPSGSGKTTLLSILGLILQPTEGTVSVDGTVVRGSMRAVRQIRVKTVGWVFQTSNVIGQRTVIDNVALGLLSLGVDRGSAEIHAGVALSRVGLGDKGDRTTRDLSGGELQRVGIARVVATRPSFVLADEPTGQLDRATSVTVLDALFSGLPEGLGLAIATHDPLVADRCERVLRLENGKLVA